MKSRILHAALAPCKLVTGRNTLSPMYKALELSGSVVRAFSSYAAIEVVTALDLTQTVIVEGVPFLAVVASLQPEAELTLSVEGNALVWACGEASGRLALLVADLPDYLPQPDATRPNFCPTPPFITALLLGSISCDSSAFGDDMATVVINGLPEGVVVSATDNHSISSCFVSYEAAKIDLAGCLALPSAAMPPEGIDLLTSIITPGHSGRIYVNEDGWVFDGSVPVAASVKYAAPPKDADILTVVNSYQSAEVVAAIPLERIDAFIKRTIALTSDRRTAVVGLSISSGRLRLAFIEGMSSTDEFFLVDGLEDVPDLSEIMLSAVKMAKALSSVTEVVLDYLERGVLIMRNPDTAFTYLLTGKLMT